MIVVKIQGGLGNQMFQYAFGIAMAEEYQDEISFELGYFNDTSSRQLGLSYFKTVIPEVPEKIHNQFHSLKARLLKKLNLYNLSRHIVHTQHQFNYYQIAHTKNSTVMYVGYWQSPLNFQNAAVLLKQHFTLKNSSISQDDINLVSQPGTVSIHIRRGDYLTADNAKVHTNLSIDYYIKAVERMQQVQPDSKYLVFSDDMEWVVDYFKIPVEWRPMDDKGYNDAEAMVLMSKCNHQIIANSTFSWWAAWLNSNSNKTVIAPKNWFANDFDDSQLIPDSWIRI